MATAYTDLLGLALPVTGELSGTWGDEVSNYITKFLDSAVAGTQVISGSQTAVTLTKTTGANLSQVGAGSSGSSQYAVIRCTGNPASTLTITAPAASKVYAVINATTTGQSVKLVGAGPTTGVTVANGKTAVVVWNGSDFVEVAPAVATNLSGGTAGALPYQTAANTTAFLSIGTSNFVLTSNGTAPVWTTNTGTGNVVRATSPTITTPTITTSITAPLLIGGTGTTSTLALRSTSGAGTTGADIIFQTGNNGATEAMRILNSGNVGIGTSSPAQLLHVLGTSTKALIATSSSTGFASVQTQSDGGTNDLEIVQYGTAATSTYFGVNRAGAAFLGASATTFGMGTKGANPVILATNNTERLRIDSSGNVGIGTNNPLIRLHVENAAGSYNSTADNNVALYLKSSSAAATNNFQGIQFAALSGNSNNSAFTIGISSPATGYSPDLIFSQRTGVSTWVERMHIDGSGNLGIGTSSPARILHVASANPTAFFDRDGGNPGAIGLRGSRGNLSAPTQSLANDTLGAVSGFGYTSASSFTSAGIANMTFYAAEALTSTAQGSYITFSTTSIGTATPSERMLISSAGNVGIGTSSASVRLQLADSSSTVYTATSAALVAPRGLISAENTSITTGSYSGIALNAKNANNNSAIGYIGVISEPTDYVCDIVFGSRTGATAYAERMRIDSTGNVGIGLTTPVNKLDVSGSFGRGAPVTKTTNFTLAATENWVICNGAGTITVTLPAASSWTGREVMIKTIAAQTVVSASSNVVPLTGGAAGTAILAATAGKWATLVSDGTNWVIMSAA